MYKPTPISAVSKFDKKFSAYKQASLVCSVFSGRSRPPMTQVFSIISSFLYKKRKGKGSGFI